MKLVKISTSKDYNIRIYIKYFYLSILNSSSNNNHMLKINILLILFMIKFVLINEKFKEIGTEGIIFTIFNKCLRMV